MKSTKRIRLLEDTEFVLASNCLNNFWKQGHILARRKDLFDWMFLRRDVWDKDGYSFAIAEINGQPVGQMGIIPFEFNRYGETGFGFWTANWSLSPEARSGVLGLNLLYEFIRPPYHTGILFGMGPGSIRIMNALKWDIIDDIPRFFLVLPDGRESFLKLLEASYPDWPSQRRKILADAFSTQESNIAKQSTVEGLPEKWNETTWRKLAQQSVGASRNFSYLKWRYPDHPIYHYRMVSVDGKAGPGLAVWRPENVIAKGANGESIEIGMLGRVVEFMAPDEITFRDLGESLLHDLATQGAFAADYMGYFGSTGVALEESGFQQTARVADGIEIPLWFNPLNAEKKTIVSSIYSLESAPDSTFSSSCPWLWTKSDADQDRPS